MSVSGGVRVSYDECQSRKESVADARLVFFVVVSCVLGMILFSMVAGLLSG